MSRTYDFKLWLRDQDDATGEASATYTQIQFFRNTQFDIEMNRIGMMGTEIAMYGGITSTDIVEDKFIRITRTDSTTGKDGTIIRDYVIREALYDRYQNSKWVSVKCMGLGSKFADKILPRSVSPPRTGDETAASAHSIVGGFVSEKSLNTGLVDTTGNADRNLRYRAEYDSVFNCIGDVARVVDAYFWVDGWSGTDVVTNGGFENYASSPGVPPNWTDAGTGDDTFTRETTLKYSGANALKMTSGGTGILRLTQSISPTVGTKYRVFGYTRTAGVAGEQAAIVVRNVTDGTDTLTLTGTAATTAYERLEGTFTPVAGKSYEIRIQHANAAPASGQILYFDAVSVMEDWYAAANHDPSVPRVHFVSPTHPYFDLTDPDTTRTIAASNTRSIRDYADKQLTIDKVYVLGAGNNDDQIVAEAGSGDREYIFNDPTIEDATTAQRLADTIIDRQDDTDRPENERMEVRRDVPKLFDENLQAFPGYKIKVTKDGSDLRVGILWSIEYKQTNEELKLTLNRRRDSFEELVNSISRTSAKSINVSQTSAPSSGSLTYGGILYGDSGGNTGQDVDLHWDDVNKRLGIGTNTPSDLLTLDTAQGFAVYTTHPTFTSDTQIVDKKYVDDSVASAAIDVREVDGSPSLTGVTTIEFDQADGFTVTDQGGGVARISVTNTSDHGNLSGLGDDDHTQYILADGTRDFSAVVSYSSTVSLTLDAQLAHKKYVDDSVGAISPPGGGTAAPGAAQYLTLAAHVDLSAERVFTAGGGLTGTDAGAGSTYTLRLADMAAATVKGRASGAGTGAPTDLSAAQLITILTGADGTGSLLDSDLLDGQHGSHYLARANHTGTQALSTISGHDKAAHDALNIDADLLDGQHGSHYLARANHTGTQLSSTISDFNEAAQDAVGQVLTDSSTIDFTYNDTSNTITASVIAGTVDAGTLDGEEGTHYLARANHTGTQALSTITGHDKAAHDALNIDADTVDGIHGASFLRSDADDTATGRIVISGASNGPAYNQSPLEISQAWNSGAGEAPTIAFHYSGSVASQIGFLKGDNSGDISILDNPGTGYETLRVRDLKVGTTQFIDGSRNIVNGVAGTFSGVLTSAGVTLSSGTITHHSTATRDKIRVWNSSSYTIGMQTGFTYGHLNNDYAMTFQMNNDNNRGFWWGDEAHTGSQGAMSLTTDGKLWVDHSITSNEGLFGFTGSTLITGIDAFVAGTNASNRYRKLFILPATGASNFGQVVITGQVGGYTDNQGKASVHLSLSTRESEQFFGLYYGNLGAMDIVIYQNADNTYTVYGKVNANNYTTEWALSAQGTVITGSSASASYVVYTDAEVETTTAPTGTLVWSLSSNFQLSLSTAGLAQFTGAINVDGAATLASGIIEGTLDVDGAATLASATVEGALDVLGNFDVDGAATLASATIEGALDVAGDTEISGTLTALGNIVTDASGIDIGDGTNPINNVFVDTIKLTTSIVDSAGSTLLDATSNSFANIDYIELKETSTVGWLVPAARGRIYIKSDNLPYYMSEGEVESPLIRNSFSTIAVSGQSSVVADSATDTLTLVSGTGVSITTNATSDSITITNSDLGSSQNIFKNIAVSGQSSVVADSNNDTLTLVAGTAIAITTNASTDTITITNPNPSVVSKSSGYSLANTDNRNVHHATGTFSIVLPTSNIDSGFNMIVNNVGTGVISFTSSGTINGKGTTLPNQYGAATVYWDGSAWYLVGDLE